MFLVCPRGEVGGGVEPLILSAVGGILVVYSGGIWSYIY